MFDVRLLLLLITGLASAADHWSYDNIDKWPGSCVTGKHQSPIDLDGSVAKDKVFNPFQFKNYNKEYVATMKNNKHSVEVRLIGEIKPSIIGGNLPSEYILDHLHFHWDSEHTMDGKRYPLELHFVHYDSRLGNLTEAVKDKGGVAVLGVFFNLSPDDDDDLEPLVELFANIGKHPNKIVELAEKISPQRLLPCDKAGFYRYTGSLTTPACDEVVTWTVFTQPLTLSTEQAKSFHTMHSDDGPLNANYRPVQKLNGRDLYIKRSPLNSSNRISLSVGLTVVSLIALIL